MSAQLRRGDARVTEVAPRGSVAAQLRTGLRGQKPAVCLWRTHALGSKILLDAQGDLLGTGSQSAQVSLSTSQHHVPNWMPCKDFVQDSNTFHSQQTRVKGRGLPENIIPRRVFKAMLFYRGVKNSGLEL